MDAYVGARITCIDSPQVGAEFGNGESFVAGEPSSILSQDEERPSGKRDVGCRVGR